MEIGFDLCACQTYDEPKREFRFGAVQPLEEDFSGDKAETARPPARVKPEADFHTGTNKDMFANISIQDFLSRVASVDPIPAGGGIAALNASSAAALIEMVARLTIDRKGYEAVWDRMRETAQECACLRAALLADIDRDAAAYRAVIAAYRLSKATPVERENRAHAIEEALRQATMVPFEIAQRAHRLMNLAGEVISHGNPHAAADGAAGMLSARAALLTAVGNIRANVISMRDTSWADRMRSEAERMEKEAGVDAFRETSGISNANTES